jgi:hypothetical protein
VVPLEPDVPQPGQPAQTPQALPSDRVALTAAAAAAAAPAARTPAAAEPASETPIEPGAADGAALANAKQPRKLKQVALHEIPENAILARNLLGTNGTLLLAAGTPFRARYLKRLEELKSIDQAGETVWIFED